MGSLTTPWNFHCRGLWNPELFGSRIPTLSSGFPQRSETEPVRFFINVIQADKDAGGNQLKIALQKQGKSYWRSGQTLSGKPHAIQPGDLMDRAEAILTASVKEQEKTGFAFQGARPEDRRRYWWAVVSLNGTSFAPGNKPGDAGQGSVEKAYSECRTAL